jgi:hypothetical protein
LTFKVKGWFISVQLPSPQAADYVQPSRAVFRERVVSRRLQGGA